MKKEEESEERKFYNEKQELKIKTDNFDDKSETIRSSGISTNKSKTGRRSSKTATSKSGTKSSRSIDAY